MIQKSKNLKNNKNKIVYDYDILSKNIILIDNNKKLVANLNLDEAIKLAEGQKSNLIQINCNINTNTSTCIICDLNKYKYELNKKQKSNNIQKIKEIRISSKSDLSDLVRNLNNMDEFLNKHISVILTLKCGKKGFDGKDEFIKSYLNSKNNISFTIQKSPRPNILKLYITRKNSSSK
ncbi:translation initiation factor IF-3 [uncultured bacterium]|nr:translation initiation factor IF-3 [uncultured bacterium]